MFSVIIFVANFGIAITFGFAFALVLDLFTVSIADSSLRKKSDLVDYEVNVSEVSLSEANVSETSLTMAKSQPFEICYLSIFGFANYIVHESISYLALIGSRQDLVVDPTIRSKGIGQMLIEWSVATHSSWPSKQRCQLTHDMFATT